MTKVSEILSIAKPYKGVFLDLDHTLYSFDSCHAYALKKCHAYFNKNLEKISFEKFHTLYLKGRKAVKKNNRGTTGSRSRHLYFQLMLESMYGKTEMKSSLRLGDLYWESFIVKIAIRPWVQGFLKGTRSRGAKTVVITNLESSLQYKKLLRLGVEDFIDFMVTSEEAGVEKPDPKIFKIALSKIGLRPNDVIMIGDDMEEDAGGAKNAGIAFYVVN